MRDLLESLAHLATIGGAIIGTAALYAIRLQLREQVKLAQAANSQAFVNISSEFVLKIAESDDLTRLWQIKVPNGEGLGDVELAKYRYLVQWWLNFFENLEYQHRCGLIDHSVFEAWVKDEVGFIRRRHVETVWDNVKSNYSDAFVRHFEPLIVQRRAELAAPAAPKPSTGAVGPVA